MIEQQLATLITLGIATIVGLMAILQYLTAREHWRTTHDRAVFDLFEERYEIYSDLRTITGMVRAGQANHDMLIKAVEALERTQFLFGQDVVAYVKRFTENVSELEGVVSEIGRGQGPEVKHHLEAQRRLRTQIESFFTEGTALFSRYILFDQKIR